MHGVTFDGQHVWFASGDKLNALDPDSGQTVHARSTSPRMPAPAFDGKHLFQIAEDRIHKIDPKTGKVLATIPAPGNRRRLAGWPGPRARSGSGSIATRKIHQIDPETGEVLRTIESSRFVTGVTWVDGELWHGTWEGRPVRPAARRSEQRRGARTDRDGAGHRRLGAGGRAATSSIAAAGRAARCARCAAPSAANPDRALDGDPRFREHAITQRIGVDDAATREIDDARRDDLTALVSPE